MKVSILTPSYNDTESIEETFQSLLCQTYEDWEWIVINDGSTDDTEARIKSLIEQYHLAEKCKYIYQENADQLNAILHGLDSVTGDYVFVLHSDDLLPSEDFLQKCVKEMEQHPDVDGLFGDLIIIDETSEIIGMQRIKRYEEEKGVPALMLLWLGRNLFSDVAFHKTEVYKNAVKYNYLTWNMPLWLDLRDGRSKMLHYRSVDFPVLKYRIHAGNYANNELGQMNVINGELRTATELMNYYDIPAYSFQYTLYRLMNKIFSGKTYKVRYKERPTRKKAEVVEFILSKRYPNGVEENVFLNAVLQFYKKNSERILKLPELPDDLKIYYGKDIRLFNKKLLNKELDKFYYDFMKEMEQGFSCIELNDRKDFERVKNILKFFCIGHVEVKV